MSNKYDAVEAAKIRPPKGKGAPQETPLGVAPPASAEPEPTPPSAPAPPAAVPPSPARDLGSVPAPAVQGYRRFRVLRARTVSWNGHITTLQPGAILDSSAFGGQPGIEKLAQQGVEMVPVD
jgi:hypothetical protein